MKTYIQVRGLNEFTFCPRLFYFIYVDEIFIDNSDTIEGSRQHSRQSKKFLSKSKDNEQEIEEKDEENPWEQIPKNLKFGDSELGLVGVLDAIEEENAYFAPVESKHSHSPSGQSNFKYDDLELSGNLWINDQAQLAGQMYLLRSNGYNCKYGYIYYKSSKKRIKLEWDENLENFLFRLVENINKLQNSSRPEPLINSQKCIRCSLNEICMPDETNFVLEKEKEPRRILTSRYDKSIVHIIDQNAFIGVSGDNIAIKKDGKVQKEVHIKDILSLSIYGNSQVSTQAISALLHEGINLTYFSSHGWLKGGLYGLNYKNTQYRLLQYSKIKDKNIDLATRIVASKISNQRIFLRRNGELNDIDFDELKTQIQKAENCTDFDTLLGIEGNSARIYFQNFPSMISEEMRVSFQFNGRNKRPPTDPVNALLSYSYSMLVRDCINACFIVGLDPSLGFFHSFEKGRPSLALDLMEAYRPIWADSAVIRAINTKMLTNKDFEITKAGCMMKENAKKAIIKAYEQRGETLVTHPIFDYPMSYRRILEVEVRLLVRYLENEIQDWSPMRVR